MVRHDVIESDARAIRALVAKEPRLRDFESLPRNIDRYVSVLSARSPVVERTPGVIYVLPNHLSYAHEAKLLRSDCLEGKRLLAELASRGMPADLAAMGFKDVGEFWPPWCVAMRGHKIASITFTARLGKRAAEAGVVTVPSMRGRGYAAAATAGWSSMRVLENRTLFYSTQQANHSSQRVAARLGLRLIGTSLSLT